MKNNLKIVHFVKKKSNNIMQCYTPCEVLLGTDTQSVLGLSLLLKQEESMMDLLGEEETMIGEKCLLVEELSVCWWKG